MKNIQRTLVLGASIVALAGCGADEIVSPGTGGNIIINNPSPSPTPTPTPTGGATVTPANGCPTINTPGGLTDAGTISGPTGTYRVCRLPATFTASDTLPYIRGLLYQVQGRVNVGTDQGFSSTNTAVTLTVEPGVILFAQAESYLVVNRGNRILSNGTAARPIVWTSQDNVLGLASDNSQAQWGGVVMLGRAPVSDCSTQVFNTAANPTANAQCEQQLEGTTVATPFGGSNSADSSGSFTYNQIRYSGFELQQSNELQSLTTGGIGSGTTINHLMSFNSSDDGMEFFGGTVNARNIAVIGASDDSLDVDTGAQANLETVLVVQRGNTGDSLIELDSPNAASTPIVALPQTRLQVNNFTFVQRSSSSSQIIRARGGAALGLTNGVMDKIDGTSTFCVRIDEQETLDALISPRSIVCDGGASNGARGDRSSAANSTTDPEVLAAFPSANNINLAAALTLTNNVVNGTFENGFTSFDATAAPARSSFFTNQGFVGSTQNAAGLTSVFTNWTCNSSIMDFGSSTGACTSLPVY